MNNDKRIFALVSLGLFLLAFLVPFIIAMSPGCGGLAICFWATAGLLALLFGVLSWSDRLGRTVTIALLIFGVGQAAVMYMIHQQKEAGAQTATIERAPAEAVRQK